MALKNSLLFVFAFLTLSCQEDVSTKPLVSNTSFGATISLHTSIEKDSLEFITVRLFDKDQKTIASKNITIYVNNTGLKLVGGEQQRYYHNYSKLLYKADSIPKNSDYKLTIILEDSLKQHIASYLPLKKQDFKQAITRDRDNFKFNWEFFSQIKSSELRIFKSFFNTVTKTNKDSSLAIASTKSVKGSYTLDKTFLKSDDAQITTYFSACLSIQKNGLLNPDLLPQSSITGYSTYCFNTKEIDSAYIKSTSYR